jgi:hypothetical protein
LRSSAPRFGALLRKEKDEAGPPDCFRRNSSNAFILRFAELKAFLFYIVLVVVLVIEDENEGRERGRFDSALVSQSKLSRIFAGQN